MLNRILRNKAQLYLKRDNHALLRRFYTLNSQRNTSNLVKDNVKIPKVRLIHTNTYEKGFLIFNYSLWSVISFSVLYSVVKKFEEETGKPKKVSVEEKQVSVDEETEKTKEASVKKEAKEIFDQQDQRNIVKLICDRDKPAESYYLLFGPQGVGKSVLTTLAATKYAKKGVLHIESSNKYSFIKNLSREMKKLNYVDYLWITCFPYSHERDWEKVFHKFEKNAEKKKSNEHYTPLLILDNVSYENRDMLRTIQLSAKAATEHGNYNVMFVTNDQKTLEYLLGNFFFNLTF